MCASCDKDCPTYRICDVLSKKWIMHILVAFTTNKTLRFSEIEQMLPDINSRMLSERLSELEEEGIVTRTVQDSKPILVSYDITEKGMDLKKIFDVFAGWDKKWEHK